MIRSEQNREGRGQECGQPEPCRWASPQATGVSTGPLPWGAEVPIAHGSWAKGLMLCLKYWVLGLERVPCDSGPRSPPFSGPWLRGNEPP